MHSFFKHLNVGKFHKLKLRNKHNFEQEAEKTMIWIQNDNQNIDGVDQHPKAWQSLLPLHWWQFIP